MFRNVENGRLAYYRKRAATSSYWSEHWSRTQLTTGEFSWAVLGELLHLEPYSNYLPQTGRILDAGCGLGRYVLALRVLGFEAEGVDYAADTINAVKRIYPDLPVRQGDVTRLDVPDDFYSAYISLGVVEHRVAGPEPFLQEARRVLSRGGIAFISVPHFHSLRRLRTSRSAKKDPPQQLSFYQYAFTPEEFSRILQTFDFEIIDRGAYGLDSGLKSEIPRLSWLLKRDHIGWRLARLINKWEWLERRWGHMLIFVCINNKD